ncbi:MAG: regulatory protein RecX [Oscillospiraceae bacterium]|nr:regulatory protein RecX [Oscillospiraceae bacterium]
MSRTIQAILPPKRPGARTVVVFDDGSTVKLLPAVAAEQGLFPGKELTAAELAALEAANSAASAKQRAVRIISAAAVSKGDLEQRLTQKGENPADARNAVRWLEELNLLDDAETARQIVSRGVSRGYGAERIKQMLYAKRIPRQYWEEALAGVPDMSDALTDFLRKRLGETPDEKAIRSAAQAAIRRGYSWTEVREALERVKSDACG